MTEPAGAAHPRGGRDSPGSNPRAAGCGALGLGALIALLGCGEEASGPLRLDLPIRPEHASMVIGLSPEGGAETIIARDIIGQVIEPIMHPLPSGDALEVSVALYKRPLVDLGLEPGPVPPMERGVESRRLPDPAEVHRAQVRPSSGGARWEYLDDLPSPLSELSLPLGDRCVAFVPKVIELGDVAPLNGVLALDDTWALVMTTGSKVFFLNGTDVESQEVPVPLSAGYTRDDGSIWLGGAGGQLFSATFQSDPSPQLELTPQGKVPSEEMIMDLVGAPDGPIEHFAVTRFFNALPGGRSDPGGSLMWFDGIAWRRTWTKRFPFGAAWVRRGYALFASNWDNGEIKVADSGALSQVIVPEVMMGSVSAVESVPGFGIAAGTTGPNLHIEPIGGSWQRHSNDRVEPMGDLHGYANGFVLSRGIGIAYAPRDNRTICPDFGVPLGNYGALNRIDVVADSVVVPFVPVEETNSRSRGLLTPIIPDESDRSGPQKVVWFTRVP